ncbi:DUF4349 domain-containing protein [Flavobacterium yafengii]|jgi:hypothetical protein|uniref:DUF4349 domain-containing protein n=1 Tax=Flavobacterium yafengii TaxID=3041253 RepID=A0AAW6TML2_9FLAO|nr:DUF4349 domain-containing protein [Flavobacterium yafengii]MDI5948422.1 DUF4349 domain-containing protein [Flavobacterium yafengii]
MKSIALFFVLFFSFSSCKKSDVAAEDIASDEKLMTIKLPPKEASAGNALYDKADLNASAKEAPQNIEPKIIKEGNLRFQTNDLTATYTQIQNAVKSHNATIQNDTEGKDYGSVFRRLIIRVPSKNFDLFLKDISKGVAYFDNKEISSQDVTAEYIDIDARLKAKKVLENRYLELLKKANKVSEMLEIEAQLSSIREEIEAKEGQLNYMQNRVSFSTITIEFYKSIAEESGVTASYGMKIWTAIKSGFNSMSSLFINLLSIWPFIIILFAIGYFIRKRFKTKKT